MVELYAGEMPFGQRANLDFTLFVGPVTCFYHNCAGDAGSERQAALCLSDVDHALGVEADKIIEALAELREGASFPLESVCIFTACQTAFAGIDFAEVQTRMRSELGLLSVHHENNRIMISDPSRGVFGSGRNGRDDFEQLVEQIPEASDGTEGLLVFSGNKTFAACNELYRAAADWGLDWVQCTGQWRSPATLARARGAAFVLAADPAFAQLARQVARDWGVGCAVVPSGCGIEGVDALYAELDRRFGARAQVGETRERAVGALDALAEAMAGRRLELAGCGEVAAGFRSWGIDARSVNPWRRGGAGGSRGAGGPHGAAGLRSGDVHFPTSGPAMRPGGGPGARRQRPCAGEFWGYRALQDAAERALKEVEAS